jgi:hypothetical protein
MLTLPEVLAQSAGEAPYTVAAQRYEVMFKDGTTVGLFVVWQRGAPQMMLRAIQFSEQLIFVFKLDGVCPGLEASLRELPARDQHGTVFYTLRGSFPNAAEFKAAVVRSKPHAIVLDALKEAA